MVPFSLSETLPKEPPTGQAGSHLDSEAFTDIYVPQCNSFPMALSLPSSSLYTKIIIILITCQYNSSWENSKHAVDEHRGTDTPFTCKVG